MIRPAWLPVQPRGETRQKGLHLREVNPTATGEATAAGNAATNSDETKT